MSLSVAQLRCSEAIRSGLECHKGEPLRFLTLTSIPSMKRSITVCFKILVKRIECMTPQMFVDLGFIHKGRLSYYFPGLDKNDFLSLDYLFVLTSEGACGVLHILFFGDYLNENWLKDSWFDITGGARSLIIKNVAVGNFDDVAGYVVNQSKNVFGYVVGQSEYVRCGYSANWVYPGWRKDFDSLKTVYCYSNRFGKHHRSDYVTKRGLTPRFVSDGLSHWERWLRWLSSRSTFQGNLDMWLSEKL